jgi:hypothetical protein
MPVALIEWGETLFSIPAWCAGCGQFSSPGGGVHAHDRSGMAETLH